MPVAKKKDDATLEVIAVKQETLTVNLLGTSPLIYNRMSEKAKRELLFPSTKTRASRAGSLKHDPVQEFRGRRHRPSSRSRAARPLRGPSQSLFTARQSRSAC